MLLKTHKIVTVAAATELMIHTNQPIGMYPLLIVVAFGASLPDIDTESSLLGHCFWFISRHLRHRGITHSIYAAGAMALWAYLSGSSIVIALAFGYVMHLVEDGFSVSGIDWFMIGWSLRFPIAYRVGGKFETMIRILAWLYMILVPLYLFGVWSSAPFNG